MNGFLQDLKHSGRMFRKTPSFTLVVIAALALGIGTNTAIFSVVNTVLLKPLAFRDPEKIVLFQNLFKQGGRSSGASPNEYNFWRQQTLAFQDVSAYAFNVANLTGEATPMQIQTTRASANFFRLCGAQVVLGRTYTADEDLPRAPKTAVLAYGFWQRRFGGDPQVIGKRLTLSGELYQIVGVVGPNLKIEIDQPPDIYVPFQLDPDRDDNGHYFSVIGRLKPDVTLAAANAQLQAGYQQYRTKHALPFDFPQIGFGAQPLQEALVGGVRNSLLILVGAVSFVLLIACANVANLLLARATSRKREIAIRAAVGAGRGRIIRQLLTESVILSLAGGVVGLAAGYAGIRAILTVTPGNIPRIGLDGSSVGLDWRVLAFTLGLSIVTGILFGLVPALQSSRADLNSTLKESSSRSGTGVAPQPDPRAAGGHGDGPGAGAAGRRGVADPHVHRDPRSETRLRPAQRPNHADVAHRPSV
jgi:predicted permease